MTRKAYNLPKSTGAQNLHSGGESAAPATSSNVSLTTSLGATNVTGDNFEPPPGPPTDIKDLHSSERGRTKDLKDSASNDERDSKEDLRDFTTSGGTGLNSKKEDPQVSASNRVKDSDSTNSQTNGRCSKDFAAADNESGKDLADRSNTMAQNADDIMTVNAPKVKFQTSGHSNQVRSENDVILPSACVPRPSDVSTKGKEGEGEEETARGCCGRKTKKKVPTVGVFELFRYAGPVEVVMMVVGTVAAMASGCPQPISLMVTGSVINAFVDDLHLRGNSTTNNSTSNSTVEAFSVIGAIDPLVIYFVIVGSCGWVASYTAVSLWMWAGERQITKIRKLFFRAVLRQDMAWFDTHQVGELNSRFSDDMYKIQEGMSDKVPVFIQWCCTCLAAYVVAFVKGWKLSLVVLTISPLFVTVAAVLSWLIRSMTVKELKAYAKAGAVAEQALRAIRTVQAFQGQEKEEKKYEDNLVEGRRVGTRKGLVLGGGSGIFFLLLYVSLGVAYYYGVVLIQDEAMRPGNVFVVFFCIVIGSISLGNAFPNLESFSTARAAAVKVYDVITLQPDIDVTSTAGKTLTTLTGVIDFQDVHFRYPARPESMVLKGLNLQVQPGQTVALVGSSGCGKSTTVQLLQRFYDPERGQISVDGHNIKDLNLCWLRDHMGVVSQEPVLFATSIADNIRYGQPDVTDDLIEAAAVEANAHDFISQLPQGYDTLVGERGAQLSGGQKQRIAIARALVKNPRILLLDEATSALDHESEAVVQSALEKARQGRTTIVIAHRLSTIRHADVIVTLGEGRGVEKGSHHQLMAMDGLYANLVKLQSRQEEEEIEVDSDVIKGASEMSDVKATPRNDLMLMPSVSLTSDKSTGSAALYRQLSNPHDSQDTHTHKEDAEEKEKEDDEEKASKSVSFRRLLQLNSPEWPFLLLGTITAAVCGVAPPSFAFIFSEFLKVFSLTDKEEQMKQTKILVAIIVSVGLALAVLRLLSSYSFSRAGSALTARLRGLTFRSMLRQDMSFYDQQENQVGSLTTRLASDAALVQGAAGSKIGSAVEALATMTAALTIAFVFSWKLTLVVLAFIPIVIASGKLQGRVFAGHNRSGKSHVQEAGKIFSEAADNIRTVMSLNRGDVFITKMERLLDSTSCAGMTTARLYGMTSSASNCSPPAEISTAQLYGITYGLSTSFQFFLFAAAFSYGAQLVSDGELEFYNVFRVFSAIIMGGNTVGRNSSLGVDYTKGRVAAGRLLALIDRLPRIDINQTGGKTLNGYTGRVAVKDAVFQYPSRETVQVLSGLTVRVEPGQTLALVGSSGCGKSTVLQLLQRFYDTHSGAVLLDGEDVKSLDLRWLRQQLGIVSQEPVLFDDSIAANITYGDNTRTVPMDDVISAARAANIHSFISSLPQGYDTNVGDKGTQLSGGQKQRIAIARALVRQPKVLLLDEATSALDTESERVVQEALDKAREGRTCIVIAHRLTTIQNADLIAVIQDGRVLETGNHSQLLAQEGAYCGFLQAQHANRKKSSSD